MHHFQGYKQKYLIGKAEKSFSFEAILRTELIA